MIYILSGNIRTGKTTALLNWEQTRSDIDGIVCPDDKYGKRYLLKIKAREKIPLEVSYDNENVISVGNFYFLKTSFDTANIYLKAIEEEKNSKYIIIDELGKLELINEGLNDSAEELIGIFESDENRHLILVVRNSLLDEIIENYQIGSYKLITTSDLENMV